MTSDSTRLSGVKEDLRKARIALVEAAFRQPQNLIRELVLDLRASGMEYPAERVRAVSEMLTNSQVAPADMINAM